MATGPLASIGGRTEGGENPHLARPSAGAFLRLLLGGVAFAAGLTGILLLAFPGSTTRYFSWGLTPPALASLIGGSYVASMFVFGLAVRAGWREVRGLVAGTLALTLPMLVVTFVHLDVFDFGRWQAWAWVLLFAASPISFGTVLLLRRVSARVEAPRLAVWARVLAALLAVGFLAMAVALWWNPVRVSDVLPFRLPPLGGRVLGCWCSFLAFLAGWAAVRGRSDEAQVPLFGVAAFIAGALVGAARNFGDLQPSTRRLGYVLVLLVMLVTSVVAASGTEPLRRHA
jgi:hypothetical protein